jgi:hypothetical protein
MGDLAVSGCRPQAADDVVERCHILVSLGAHKTPQT